MSKHPLYNQTGLQRDNKSHVLYALANKQMELKLIQDEYEAKISKIRVDLLALETTICLFNGDCSKTIEKLNINTITKVKDDYYFLSVFPESELEDFKAASHILARNGSSKSARQLGLL
jgi:hypothetical protein